MSHLTTDNLIKILDELSVRPNWKVVMASIGASERLAFVWSAQSAKAKHENDKGSPFYLEFRGVWDFWHCHCGRSRAEAIALYEAVVRDQALRGVEEPVLGPDQRPIYKERPEYIGREDDYIRLVEGLDVGASVAWHRLEHDADGNPIPLTKTTQLPAPLRLRVLEQDRRYVAKQEMDVHHSGEIAVAKPLERLPGERRPDIARLKELAAMSPEARRAALGTSGVAVDQHGRRMLPALSPPMNRDQPDDEGRGLRPAPQGYVAPPKPAPEPEPPRPSYARPSNSLDQSGRGDGTSPPGGFKVA